MLDNINLNNILFLDVETAPQAAAYGELSDTMKTLWDEKAKWLVKEDQTPEDVYTKSGIFAEFGKIICISVGYFHPLPDKSREFRIKSFYGHDEKQILSDFAELLRNHYNSPKHILCAHNGKEFDFPYLGRRMLVNGVKIPPILDLSGKKPWEVGHLDTMHLWRFGDYKHYTSLKLLAAILNIPTPKDDIEGKDVGRVYWQEKDLARIVTYCQKDTLTVAQLILRYKGENLIQPDEVIIT